MLPNRLVLKIGTNTVAKGGARANAERLAALAAQVAHARSRGVEVLVVSSGAVGLGMGQLNLEKRPGDLPTLQACAAIGQALLMEAWRQALEAHQLLCAQVLLTHDDVRHRERHLNVRATLERLLRLGVVPVINENDTVSHAEIKFGDNDLLSALVASLCRAQLLVILTTVAGLLNRGQGNALVPLVEEITPEIEALAGGAETQTSVGGMASKLAAAKVAIHSGCGVFIGDGTNPSLLPSLLRGEAVGTFFVPRKLPLQAKKRWIAFFGKPRGSVRVDAGAVAALREGGKSLLAKGIIGVTGDFGEGDLVNIEGPDGRVFARGLARFGRPAVAAIQGESSAALKARYPDRKHLEVVHRDAMVLVS